MHYDVAIAGSGTAGAAAAYACARRGLSVLCLDRRPLDGAGARWVNGVPAWCFDLGELERPRGDELRDDRAPFHLVAGWGPARVTVAEHEVLGVDMRLLVARLQRLAREAGADLRGEIAVSGFERGELTTSAGRFRARFFVDASGVGATSLPVPRVERRDLCAAAQQVRRVRDAGAARAFFEARDARPGDTLCFSGVAGGYSIVNARLDADCVSLLTGGIPADGHASGARLIADFVRAQPWIGDVVFGGQRAIPLRRPYARLASDDVALLGDAACQVFSAHGSGIGTGLVAARMLAEAVVRGELRGYEVAWTRRFGALLAASDLLRRFSQTLEPEEIRWLVESGLLDAESVRAGLEQRLPRLGASAVRRAGALARRPSLARRFSGLGARLLAVRALYARVPAARLAFESHARAAEWVT